MKHLVIDKTEIAGNLQIVREAAGKAEIYADLSGDAYGLGLLETAKLLRDSGVRSFAVSDPKDAHALRQAGFMEERIMMLRSTADSDELEELIDLNVICTAGSYDAAVAINGLAEARHTVCEVQVKIDVGLGRYGFTPQELDKVASIYRYMSNLAVVGVFSTFSDSTKKKQTLAEYDTFLNVLDRLVAQGYETGTRHICDSVALFRYGMDPLDAVRVGPALSGRVQDKNAPGIRKVGYIEAAIEEVGWYPRGHQIGRRVTLRQAARLAVLSVGYYHGFGVDRQDLESGILDLLRRRRSQKFVKIGGKRARVLGTIGMMHTIVDVTDVPCAVGDPAILDVDPVCVKGLPRVYKHV